MTENLRNAIDEHRRLVQRILAGGIPKGKEFDACREVLQTDCDEDEAFAALCLLLQGAVADPFFDLRETRQVVMILKGLSRDEVGIKELV